MLTTGCVIYDDFLDVARRPGQRREGKQQGHSHDLAVKPRNQNRRGWRLHDLSDTASIKWPGAARYLCQQLAESLDGSGVGVDEHGDLYMTHDFIVTSRRDTAPDAAAVPRCAGAAALRFGTGARHSVRPVCACSGSWSQAPRETTNSVDQSETGWLDCDMAGDYPQLLVDRDVIVIRNGQNEQTRVRGWLAGYDGPVPTYRIELAVREGNYICPYTATGPDMFEALVRLRRQLEPDGLMIAVQGSRGDTYPSGMARDMGGGMRVYVMRSGRSAGPDDLVETLDDASPDQLATVDQQREAAEAQWTEFRAR